MRKLFVLVAILAFAFTACYVPLVNTETELPTLTIKNESSYVLTDVKFSGISFEDLNLGHQAVKQLTADNVKKTGYITFTRKDIGIPCRTQHVLSDQDIIFTFIDNTLVEEMGNSGNKNTLSKITFLSQVTVERSGMAVAKNDNVNLGESAINYSTQIELTIKNTGVGKLLFGVNEPVKISEAEADIFSVVQPSSNEIESNGSLTFKININPKEIKNYTAVVTITSNDQSGDYKFSITTTGRFPKPIASVFYGDGEISQNGTIDAGDIFITYSKTITVTVKNTGEEVLTIDTAGITITGADAAVFAKTTDPASNISAGGQTSFDIACYSERQGDNSATLTIPTNDNSRNPVVAYLRVRALQPIYYTVNFNADEGEPAPESQTILQGSTVNAPGAMSKTGYAFVGWYKEAGLINQWNFSGDTVIGNITLYAKWELPTVTVPGVNLAAKLAWLQSNAVSDGNYAVEVNANENIGPQPLSFSGNSNISITLIGVGTMRTVNLSALGSLFTITSGVTLILDNNVTLNGRSGNTYSLVNINSGGTLIMNQGAKITGNTYTSRGAGGGGVYNTGTFIINGGEISGNSVELTGGGVYNNGTFIMSGGKISGNTSYNGGGVYNTGTFTMSGGEISGNTSSRYGGGVYNSTGIFTMSGGVIYGSGAAVGLRNSANSGATLSTGTRYTTTQYGIFSGDTFNWKGDLATTNTTIRIVNGILQTS